jgi:hypothetical protein
MKLSKIHYRAIIVITILLSVFGLAISPASAAPAVSFSGNPAGMHASTTGSYNVFSITKDLTARFQTVLANLNHLGVGVSQTRTDLAAGNVSAAMQRLTAYQKEHPVGNGNRTALQRSISTQAAAARLQTVLINLNHQGVDVSQARTDLAAGNVRAATQWITAYQKEHPAGNGNRTALQRSTRTPVQTGGLVQTRR